MNIHEETLSRNLKPCLRTFCCFSAHMHACSSNPILIFFEEIKEGLETGSRATMSSTRRRKKELTHTDTGTWDSL